MGRQLTSIVAGQQVSAVTYDPQGRPATATDARGITRSFTYDSMGRLLSTTMPDGSLDQTTYGVDGVLTHTDRGGATTTYTHDAFGRRASLTNPNNETTAYEYDLSGRTTALVDAKGNRTEWVYDGEGRMTTKTYADNSQHTYTHDSLGRQLTRTDARGRTTTYTYNAHGRPLTVDYPNDTDLAFTYDVLGRRTSVTDAAGTATYTYDSQTGYLTGVDGPLAADALTITRNALGQRTGTALDQATVSTITYDALGRVASINDGPSAFTYGYAGNSPVVSSVSRPGGITTTRFFDSLGRLVSTTHSRPGQAPAATIASFAYTLDDHDRRTRIDLVDGGRWDYTHDSTGQLTGATRTGTKTGGTTGTLVTYDYQYDAMGNPAQRTEDAGVSTYTFNSLNQLSTGDWAGTLSAFGWTQTGGLASLTVADANQTVPATVLEPGQWTAKGLAANAGSNTYTVTRTANDATTAQAQATLTRPVAQTTYTHDADGNMLGQDDWTYTWNNENRLATATRADGLQKLEFVYDFQGRRRIKRVYSRPTTNDGFALATTILFVYDGWLLLQERITNHVADVTTTRTYLHGLDLRGQLGCEGMDANATAGGIGGMLAVSTTRSDSTVASSLLYLYDGNGNVANLVDPVTTESAAAYEYSPFGKTLVAHGPLAEINPFRFSAKYTDTETDLVYYGYRYYAPESGRWINRDPIRESEDPNLYRFVSGGPVSNYDVLGLYTPGDVRCANTAIKRMHRIFRAYDENKVTSLFGGFVLLDAFYDNAKGHERMMIFYRVKVVCKNKKRELLPAYGFYGLRDLVIEGGAATGRVTGREMQRAKMADRKFGKYFHLFDKSVVQPFGTKCGVTCTMETKEHGIIHSHPEGAFEPSERMGEGKGDQAVAADSGQIHYLFAMEGGTSTDSYFVPYSGTKVYPKVKMGP